MADGSRKYRNGDARIGEIVSDQVVTFSKGKADSRPGYPVRVICVRIKPHTSRGKYRGGSRGVVSDAILQIATNLPDVPADIIALIDSKRWTIEILFQVLPTDPGLPASIESRPKQHRNPDLMCDHSVQANQPPNRQEGNAAHP